MVSKLFAFPTVFHIFFPSKSRTSLFGLTEDSLHLQLVFQMHCLHSRALGFGIESHNELLCHLCSASDILETGYQSEQAMQCCRNKYPNTQWHDTATISLSHATHLTRRALRLQGRHKLPLVMCFRHHPARGKRRCGTVH